MPTVPPDVTAVRSVADAATAPTRAGRPAIVIAGTVLALAFTATYLPVIGILREQWATNDTYSFGVLVPFISGYLIWTRLDRLKVLQVSPGLVAGSLMVTGAATLLLLGRLTAIVALQELSMVAMLAGLVLLVLGYGFLRALLFPLAYLLLMLPVWEFLTDPLHHPSQLFSAGIADRVLTAVGVPVLREGVYLHLPNITLEVASACSGINFLVAVLAVGVLQAYLYLEGWLPRATVIAFGMAIALLSNGLRVALIGLLSYYELSDSLHGPGHVLQGLFVSSLGVLALLASVNVLSRRYGRPPNKDREATAAAQSQAASAPRVAWACVGGAALLFAVSVVRPHAIVIAAAGEASPPTMGSEWRQLPGTVAAPYIAGGAGDRMIGWVFEPPTGPRVQLYIGNLAQSAPGGGLMYRSVALPVDVSPSQAVLALDADTTLRVNRAAFADGNREMHVIYWYDLSGRPTAQVSAAKAYASAQMLTSWGAPPQLVMAVATGASREPADQELLSRLVLDVFRTLTNQGRTK